MPKRRTRGRRIDLALIHKFFIGALGQIENRFSRICRHVRFKNHVQVHAWAAEMSLVNAVTLWERYLRELLVGLIAHEPTQFRRDLDLPDGMPITRPLINAVLQGPRYLEIRRFSDVNALAKRFVGDRLNIFPSVGTKVAQEVDDAVIVRNHIIHESSFSKKAYRKVLQRNGIQGMTKKPGFFLLVGSRGGCRMNSLLRGMKRAVAILKRKTALAERHDRVDPYRSDECL